MKMTRFATVAVVAIAISSLDPAAAQDQATPVFRTSVAVVPITAVVRDARNRLVRNLTKDDFRVMENGEPRRILEFRAADAAPVSVALLLDTSGSMRISSNLQKAREFAGNLLNRLDQRSDETALFTFDSTLHNEVPFTRDRHLVHSALASIDPWGHTSLYDAIAETAKQLPDRPAMRRILLVITDGIDTSSTLRPEEVSGIASAIDVPVYVVAMVSPADLLTHSPATPLTEEDDLANLSYWTGGDLSYVRGPEDFDAVAAELLATLRHQYFLAIESSAAGGWHRLDIRTRRGLTVRARGGYFAIPD
jgi:Ca-activated chloride channel homolog